MEVAEAVVNVFDFIDKLNCNENTDVQHLRNSDENRGHKRHREGDICCDDNDRIGSSGYVRQLDSQRLSSRYVQRARKRAATPAGAPSDASVGAAAGATALAGSSLGRAAARAALLGNALGVTATETTEVSVGSAAGPTTVAVGNESAGAAAEETTLGKLSRRQAKSFKHRMNKMKVM